MAKVLVKLFNDPAVAVNAIRELQSMGVKAGDIGIAVRAENSAELARRAEIAITTKVEAAEIGTLALAGPAAAGDSIDSLAKIWDIDKAGFGYYESGLRRGGVIISVSVDEAQAGKIKAALRNVDASHVIPADPPTNDRPFFLSDRATKSDDRDKLFSGDFRKY